MALLFIFSTNSRITISGMSTVSDVKCDLIKRKNLTNMRNILKALPPD